MNRILIVGLSLLLISCNYKRNDIELTIHNFPKIIHDKTTDSLSIFPIRSLNDGKHHPLFIGEYCHEIKIKENIILTNGFQKYIDDYWKSIKRLKWSDSTIMPIIIDTTQILEVNNRKSFPILIQNNTKDSVLIGYGDRIPLITEALNQNGEWQAIEERYVYMCGTGLNSIILPPNELLISSIFIYSGDLPTKLRVKMGNNYSQEFLGNIHKTQFLNEWDNYVNDRNFRN